MLLQVPRSDTDCALEWNEMRKSAVTIEIMVLFIRAKIILFPNIIFEV
jgi:hypothetical protein